VLKVPRPLAELSRETRDTLFLLVVVAWILLLHTPYLPGWSSALSWTLLLGRCWLALKQRALPHPGWRGALLLLIVVATWLQYRTLLGQQTGVTLVVLLLALKTLELRAPRDALVVFFLGFFTLLSQFFHSQSLPTALAMLLALWGLLSALVNAQLPVGRPPLALAARIAGQLMLLGAPLMLVLFLFFPRLGPLWSLPADALGGHAGLSASMRIGQIAQLALDDRIALRVRFDDPPPAPYALYFRGPVLSAFDGIEWRPSPSAADAQAAGLRVEGAPVRYQVTLEPSGLPWLFLLEASAQAPLIPGYLVRMSSELQWLTDRPVTELLRYQAQSYPRFRHGPEVASPVLDEWLALPQGYNPRTLALAALWRQEIDQTLRPAQESGLSKVERALTHLRQGGYRYTLEPGRFGRDSADEFWFDRRAGFCEHIAASFVILLRAMGVPARVVTGYQGGERNPVDGLWSVRQSDAHAWAEVWLPGRGWTRVDPTAAVQPQRIDALERLRPAPGPLTEAMIRVSPSLAVQLGRVWEALDARWKQWVLDYGQQRQFDLLQRLGIDGADPGELLRLLSWLLAALCLAAAAWALWRTRSRDPWLALLQRTRHRLRRAGYEVTAQATPRQLAQLLATDGRTGRRFEPLQAWLLELERQRYDPASQRPLAELRREARALDWPGPERPAAGPDGPA
jgi:transglutaminase-like putative cysteine protease